MGLTSGEKSFWGRSDGNEAVSRVSRACTSPGSACEVSVERGMLAIWSKVEVVDAIELLSTWGRERGMPITYCICQRWNLDLGSHS